MKLRKDQPKQSQKPQQKTTARTSHGLQTVDWHEMNRKQRREMARKIQAEDLSLEVVHPHAAGISATNPTTWPCRQPATSSRCGASVAPPPS